MNDLLPEVTSGLWPSDFLLELALGLEPEYDIIARYEITPMQLQQWYEHPVFKKELSDLRKRVIDEGLTFKTKCKAQAEDYLRDIHLVMKDKATAANVKLEILKNLARWAGFDPKEEKNKTEVNVSVNAVGNLISQIANTSRELVPADKKEIRAKSWREE